MILLLCAAVSVAIPSQGVGGRDHARSLCPAECRENVDREFGWPRLEEPERPGEVGLRPRFIGHLTVLHHHAYLPALSREPEHSREAHISAPQSPSRTYPRISGTHGHQERSEGFEQPSP